MIAGVVLWQAAGDDQGIAAARAQQLNDLTLGVWLVIGSGDQQLVAALPRLLLQQLGQACITGVLQIRNNEAQRARLSSAQAGWSS